MKLVSFDVETSGTEREYALQPFRARTGDAWLTMCACATGEGSVAGELKPSVEHLRNWLETCAGNRLTICGWNVPFDMAWLIALGLRKEVYANKWLDGMLLWRHRIAAPEWTLLAPKSYGLKAAVTEFLPGFAGYEADIDFFSEEPADVAARFEYNKKDALYTLMLVRGFWQQLAPVQRRCALIEAQCLPMVAESYVDGICADRDNAEALAAKLDEQANLAMVKLKLTTQEDIDEKILASPVKLRKLLFEDWKLPVVKVTAKDAASTDRDALSQLSALDERAGLLNEFRECRNNRTKFALGAVRSLEYNGDGRVRPNAKPFGTYTGRMTYGSKIGRGVNERPTGVALHQWKRAAEFRDILHAPEGYTLLEFDFSGQEFRWMAVMSGDPTMLKMCEPGEDAHAFMGSKIGKIAYPDMLKMLDVLDPKAKSFRQMGKVGNLSCQYRTSAPTLKRVARVQFQLHLTEQESKAIHGTYRLTYPLVQRYWKEQIKNARIDGYVETVAGRRVHVGKGETWDCLRVDAQGDERYVNNTWGCESTAINAPIQGSGADQKYLALAVLKDMLPRYDGRFYFELHDSVCIVVPDQHAKRAYVEIRHALSNLPYKKAWGVDLPVLFPVDGKAGTSWGSLVDPKWV